MANEKRDDVPDRYPDFLVIGATRSGTTTLNHVIGSHPEIFIPFDKELHYFDRNDRFSEDLEGYKELFSGYGGERFIGEVTPSYWKLRIRSKENPGEFIDPVHRISVCLPYVKLIVSLRDPLTRLKSAYTKEFYNGRLSKDLEHYLRLDKSGEKKFGLLSSCLKYHKNLGHILKLFPREALKVLIFEEWTGNQIETMRSVFSFIGADPYFSIAPVSVNASSRYRTDGEAREPNSEISLEMREYVIEAAAKNRRWIEKFLERPVPWSE